MIEEKTGFDVAFMTKRMHVGVVADGRRFDSQSGCAVFLQPFADAGEKKTKLVFGAAVL